MGAKEIVLLVVLPFVLWTLFASFGIIDQLQQKAVITKNRGYLYKYIAFLCPPIAYLLLKINQRKSAALDLKQKGTNLD